MKSWRRKWQPTPVFLPGKRHGQRSLAGYSSWGHKRDRQNLVTTEPKAFRTLKVPEKLRENSEHVRKRLPSTPEMFPGQHTEYRGKGKPPLPSPRSLIPKCQGFGNCNYFIAPLIQSSLGEDNKTWNI